MSANRADPRSVFGPAAERYASSAVHGSPFALGRLIEIAQPRGGRLLDVATGSGHTAIAFAPHMDQVVASDLSADMLRVCRREAHAKGIENLQICVAMAEALPFQAGSFEGVAVRLAPHHFQSVDRFLREAFRVLCRGGWVLISDTVGPEDPVSRERLDLIERLRDPSHAADLSVTDWKERLSRNGFELLHDEAHRKAMDAQEWLDRLTVPEGIQEQIMDLVKSAQGDLRAYLAPRTEGGKEFFDLSEHAFFARKKN